jgi:cell division septation protein DedD
VGYRFSLILSREVTDEESATLKEACVSAPAFGTDSLPTNADVTVTKMDFDDTASPTLAEAIQAGLDAVKSVPDLSIPGLTVPAQPAGPVTEDHEVVAGEVVEEIEVAAEGPAVAAEQPAARKPSTRKPATRKTTTKKASVTSNGHANGNGKKPDETSELVEAMSAPADRPPAS